MNQLGFFKNNIEPEKIFLDENHHIEIHRAVPIFLIDPLTFTNLWNKHPKEFHEVVMHGRLVKTPRWQQAYGKNYDYSGARNTALPLTLIDDKYLKWCQENINADLNGLLINWYEGEKNH